VGKVVSFHRELLGGGYWKQSGHITTKRSQGAFGLGGKGGEGKKGTPPNETLV